MEKEFKPVYETKELKTEKETKDGFISKSNIKRNRIRTRKRNGSKGMGTN